MSQGQGKSGDQTQNISHSVSCSMVSSQTDSSARHSCNNIRHRMDVFPPLSKFFLEAIRGLDDQATSCQLQMTSSSGHNTHDRICCHVASRDGFQL